MESTRSITEIVVIREGFLALTPFHYSLKDWELTKAGRKAKKHETKKKRKDKLQAFRQAKIREQLTDYPVNHEGKEEILVAELCKGVIQKAINELSEEEGFSTEVFTATLEEDEELAVNDFCRRIIQDAVNGISDEEGCSTEGFVASKEEQEEIAVADYCRKLIFEAIEELCHEEGRSIEANRKIAADLDKEIKDKIDSLEKGEGDVGIAATPADLVDAKDDGNPQETEIQQNVASSGEPEHRTIAPLDVEDPAISEACTAVKVPAEPDKKDFYKNEKLSKKEAKAEKKRQETEIQERLKIEKEQIRATKKYFEMINEAMKSRSIVLKLFWEKTVAENNRQQKRQERLRQKELKKERLEQKAQEKLKKKQQSGSPLKEGGNDALNETTSAALQTAARDVSRGTGMVDDGNNNHVISSKDDAKQLAADKTGKKTKLGSRVLRFFGRLYGELVF